MMFMLHEVEDFLMGVSNALCPTWWANGHMPDGAKPGLRARLSIGELTQCGSAGITFSLQMPDITLQEYLKKLINGDIMVILLLNYKISKI